LSDGDTRTPRVGEAFILRLVAAYLDTGEVQAGRVGRKIAGDDSRTRQ
jgi:hypothetical protein